MYVCRALLCCPAGMVMDGVSGQATDDIGQIQLSCSTWGVQADPSGSWGIRRTGTGMSPVGGFGPGMPFGPWTISDDPTTMNPGAIRTFATRYSIGAAGVVIRLTARGSSTFLRVR